MPAENRAMVGSKAAVGTKHRWRLLRSSAIEPTAANAHLLMRVSHRFGLPLVGVTEDDFAEPNTQFSIGVPPCEIDLLTSVPGLDFQKCWDNRVLSNQEGIDIPYVGEADLITAKETAERPQDLADLNELHRAEQ